MTTLLISNMFPPAAGGSGRWFWELYRRLPRHDYVIAAGEHRDAATFDLTHDLQLERLPLAFESWGILGWSSLVSYNRAWRRLKRIIRTRNVQVIHAGCTLPEGWLAWLFHRRYGIPYAVYVHGEELQVFRSSRELSWLARRVLRDAHLVIANSENTAELLRTSWPVSAEVLKVFHPGVDTNYFQPAPCDPRIRELLGWYDRPVILTVGRLQRRKGHDVLIEALSAVKETIPDVLYAIIGDGVERERLERLVEARGLRQHVKFHGSVDDDLMRQAYQQCSLFVLPNREVDGDFEGFGLVLLEAQACGRPVVTGLSGGTTETMSLGATGEAVDCTDAQSLATKLISLLEDRTRLERMGVAARKWTVDHFDWSSLASRAPQVFALRNKASQPLSRHIANHT